MMMNTEHKIFQEKQQERRAHKGGGIQEVAMGTAPGLGAGNVPVRSSTECTVGIKVALTTLWAVCRTCLDTASETCNHQTVIPAIVRAQKL